MVRATFSVSFTCFSSPGTVIDKNLKNLTVFSDIVLACIFIDIFFTLNR